MTDEREAGVDDLHEPSDEAFASLGLELRRPVLIGDDKATRAWQEIRAAYRATGQAVQRAIGEVVLHVRSMRAVGKTRFATPSERAQEKLGVPLASECYTAEDLDLLNAAIADSLKASGTSEYVYSSVARKLMLSEFSKSKLARFVPSRWRCCTLRSSPSWGHGDVARFVPSRWPCCFLAMPAGYHGRAGDSRLVPGPGGPRTCAGRSPGSGRSRSRGAGSSRRPIARSRGSRSSSACRSSWIHLGTS